MTDLQQSYYEYLNNSDTSANTKASYLRDLSQFFEYLSSIGIDEKSATSNDINIYIQQLEAAGKSAATVTRMLASIRGFYKYLISNNIVSENPAVTVKTSKKSKRNLPEILTDREVTLLLSQPDLTDFKGIRDKAMLELLYSTGIKVSELVELNVNDVNVSLGLLYCNSDKHERIIPIFPQTLKIVSNYIVQTRPLLVTGNDQNALFVNMNGNRLTRQGFWKIIKSYTKSANINKDVTPHMLRHSFAAHLLENGANLKDIQEVLGHSDISSTQVYSQLIKKKYQDTLNRIHPNKKAQ